MKTNHSNYNKSIPRKRFNPSINNNNPRRTLAFSSFIYLLLFILFLILNIDILKRLDSNLNRKINHGKAMLTLGRFCREKQNIVQSRANGK